MKTKVEVGLKPGYVVDKDNLSSNHTPRNRTHFSGEALLILSMGDPSRRSSGTWVWGVGEKRRYLVFLVFSVRLLDLNHSEAFASSRLALPNNSWRSHPSTMKVVSSANKIVKSSVAWERSLIKIKN